MVNRYNEIADKMPWTKKKNNPKRPWDSQAQEVSDTPSSNVIANKDDVISKIKNIQAKLNAVKEEKEILAEEKRILIEEKDALNNELESAKEEINEKNDIISEKENEVKELNEQVQALEKEKEAWDIKLNDLQKVLKTATSEKLYLENELAAADSAISEINNLLSS